MAVLGSAFAKFSRTFKQESLVSDLLRCRQAPHSLPWKRRPFSVRARMANQSSASNMYAPPPKPLVTKNTTTRPAGPRIEDRRPNRLRAALDTMKPGERIVLYRSGNHGSFYVFAYSIGGTMLVGAYLWAQMFLTEREGVTKPGNILKGVMVFEAVAVAGVATAIFLAPTNLINKVSIFKQVSTATRGQSPFLLEFSIRRRLPFLKPDILETSFDKVSISPAVPGQRFTYASIPLEKMGEFSSDTWQMGKKSTIIDSILGIVPAFIRETKRSFLRDQMALVVVQGAGTHKLDLQGAALLDNGALLGEFMKRSEPASLWGRLVARWGSWFQTGGR